MQFIINCICIRGMRMRHISYLVSHTFLFMKKLFFATFKQDRINIVFYRRRPLRIRLKKLLQCTPKQAKKQRYLQRIPVSCWNVNNMSEIRSKAVPHSLLQGVHYEFEEMRDGHLRRVPSNHIPTACPHSVIHRLELW